MREAEDAPKEIPLVENEGDDKEHKVLRFEHNDSVKRKETIMTFADVDSDSQAPRREHSSTK